MARDFDGAADYLTTTTMPSISSLPFTMACWIQNEIADSRFIVTFGNNASYTDSLSFVTTVAGAKYKPQMHVGGTTITAGTSFGVSAATWHCCIGGCDAAGNGWINVDNGASTGSAAACAFPSAFNISRLAARQTTPAGYFDGRIAEIALWNVDFGASGPEIDALNNRISPLLVRPGSLVAYVPLLENTTGDTHDEITGAVYAQTSNPAAAAHPPIIRPSKSIWTPFASGAAPGGLSIPVAIHNYRRRRVAV